mmetsp:Transcript_7961/g.12794  ORF Transcript_7961/g.12794 Transcript_7961/m.12794 type:complete len:276 (+) Transcript_7961:274-1101(+)
MLVQLLRTALLFNFLLCDSFYHVSAACYAPGVVNGRTTGSRCCSKLSSSAAAGLLTRRRQRTLPIAAWRKRSILQSVSPQAVNENSMPPEEAEKNSNGGSSSMRIVITGATKGLGRALATSFLRAGDKVLISSRDEARVQETEEELRKLGTGEVLGIKCDVTNSEDLARISSTAADRWGGIDMWICNAATNGYMFKDLIEMPEDTLIEISSTNLLGTMLSAREAIKSMTTGRGESRSSSSSSSSVGCCNNISSNSNDLTPSSSPSSSRYDSQNSL